MKLHFLIAIILIGAFVRIWKFDSLPFPPHDGILAYAYYGWSLLHFGTDEFKNFLPSSFLSIGDYKYPGLAYLNILPAAIFGLNEIVVSFWGIIAGIALIPLTFFLSLKLFDNKIIALTSALLIALSPWNIMSTRRGYENDIALALTVAGLLCLLHLDKKIKQKRLLFLSSLIFFTISSFLYAAQRVFIPLILLITLFLSSFKKGILIIFFIMLIIISLSLIPSENRGRTSQILWQELSHDQKNRLQELYVGAGTSEIKVPVILTRLFHNKIRVSIEDFLYRYSNHFSPKFLFFEGEAAIERIPDTGVLPLILIFFFPLGAVTILSLKNKKTALFIFSWLLISPIPSALTVGEPHMNRASLMLLPITLISSFGYFKFISFFKGKTRKIMFTFVLILFIFNSLYLLNQIFVQKPLDKPWVPEQVNKTLVLEIAKIKGNYEAVVLPKVDYIYFLFYWKISPADFISRSTIRPLTEGTSYNRVERLDNIYFNMVFDCPKSGKENVLYVCKGLNIPQNSKVIKVIRYLDDIPAYTFLEFYPISKMSGELPLLPERLMYMVDIEKSPNIPDGIIPKNANNFW